MTASQPPNPPRHGEWQPIKTAPTDGTEFIGYGKRHGTYGYTDDEWTWTGCRWSNGAWCTTKAEPRYSHGFTFSHWYPLPAEEPQR